MADHQHDPRGEAHPHRLGVTHEEEEHHRDEQEKEDARRVDGEGVGGGFRGCHERGGLCHAWA